MSRAIIMALGVSLLVSIDSGEAQNLRPTAPNTIRVSSTVSMKRLLRPISGKAVREFQRAEKAQRKNKNKEFEQHMLRAIELAPSYTEALNNLGIFYLDQGDRIKASELLYRAEQSDPGCAAVLFNRGLLAISQNEFASAETLMRRTLELDPNFVHAHFLLGAVLQREPRKAEEAIAQLRTTTGEFPEAHMRMAWIYIQQRRKKEALAEAKEYVATGEQKHRALALYWLRTM